MSDDAIEIADRREIQFGILLPEDVDSDEFRALSPRAVRVIVVLWSYSGVRARRAWPTRRTLAEQTGLTETTVSRAVTELRDAGFVEIDPSRRRNVYALKSPAPR